MKVKRALFIGRFQPFHHGHHYAIKKLLKRYGEVVVVIGSSQDQDTPDNPFTCGERIEMIRSCFNKSELARLIIVPVPDVNDNQVWVDQVFAHIPPVDDVYSNNAMVKMLFSKHGFLVKSIEFYDRGPKEGTVIRRMMSENDPDWKKHVPKNVDRYLDSIGAIERMRAIVRMGWRHS